MWGFLGILWPFTYFQIEVISMFYLQYYWAIGIYGGWILASIGAILLAISAIKDSEAWLYFGIHATVESALVFISFLQYPEAYKYYLPEAVIVTKYS